MTVLLPSGPRVLLVRSCPRARPGPRSHARAASQQSGSDWLRTTLPDARSRSSSRTSAGAQGRRREDRGDGALGRRLEEGPDERDEGPPNESGVLTWLAAPVTKSGPLTTPLMSCSTMMNATVCVRTRRPTMTDAFRVDVMESRSRASQGLGRAGTFDCGTSATWRRECSRVPGCPAFVAMPGKRSGGGLAGPSDRDDELASYLAGDEVPHGRRCLAERVGPLDGGNERAVLDQGREALEERVVLLGRDERHALADER